MTYAKIVEGYTIRPGAYLKGANLNDAYIIGANLEDTNFKHIRYDSNTKYDEGSTLDLYIKSLEKNK